MKKLLLTLVSCVLAIYANAWTVYFTNPNNWSSVAVWCWDGNNTNTNYTGGSWPGKAMTKLGNGIWSYTGTGSLPSTAKLLFNSNVQSGASQTNDLLFQDNMLYGYNGVLDLYVIGDNVNSNNWALKTNKMTQIGKGVFEWTGNTLGSNFKINDGTWDATYNIGGGGKIKLGTAYTYNKGSNSGDIEFDGFSTISNPKIVLDMIAGTLTLTQHYPEKLYILGYVNGNVFDSNSGAEMKSTGTPGVYSGTFDLTPNPGDGYSYFSFTKVLSSNWDDIADSRYGAINNNTVVKNTVGTNQIFNIQSGENSFKAEPGNYTITVDLTKNTVSIILNKLAPTYPENLYLIGTIKGNNWDPTRPLAMTNNGNGKYTISNVDLSDVYATSFSFCTNKSNNGNDWTSIQPRYGAGEGLGTDKGFTSGVPMKLYQANNDVGAFTGPSGKYNITVDLDAMTMTATLVEYVFPKEMYIYGHLNDLAWEINNYEPMIAGNTPGVFTANNVEISGRWNKHDADGNDSRDEFGSTEDENYIAFYDHVIIDQNTFNSTPKFTTTLEDKNEKISKENNVNVANLKYRTTDHNFHVPEGIYNITVDLTNMTVTFEKVVKKTVEFVWYQGGHGDYEEATMLPEDRQDEHSLVFGDEKPDILQVGIGTNPTHRVARMVEYTVWYKAPGKTSSAKAVKRYADENQTNYKELGYNEAVPSTTDDEGNVIELGDYTIIGSSNYSDNHLIQLNKAGDYAIIASVDVNQKELKEYYEVEDNVLLVSVAQADADVTFSPSKSSVPFPVKEDATLEGALEFEQELVLGKDFSISIKAKNDAAGWAVPNNAEDLDASYQAQLTENLYSQYKQLGENIKVDGFYIKGQETVTANSEDNYTHDVLVNVPCSGVYEVTVAPVANGNYKFDAITTDISIYPNLQAKFGKDYGFNIDRYMFADDDDAKAGKIEFPTEKFDYHIREAFIPGSYFVNYFSTEPNSVKAMSVNPGDYRENYKDQCYVDLGEGFTNNGSEGTNLEIYVAKNGAANHYTFNVVPTDGNGNVSTGVEGIETVDGEAEYYNLQGVKVSNPEKGIYIKVVNGKAQKVLVK